MNDEIEQLEAKLKSMQPAAPSMIVRERIRASVSKAGSRARWKYQLMSVAAMILIAVALVKVFWPTRSVMPAPADVAVKPTRDSATPPTLAAYQSAALFEPERLDRLLAEQSARLLPPTSEMNMRQP